MMRTILLALVRAYQLLFGSWIGPSCRFEPTCSAYSVQAITRHGAAAGTYLTLARVVRCHPWCEGGADPVPDRVRPPGFLTQLVSPLSKKKSS